MIGTKTIRPFTTADNDEVAGVWWRSGRDEYDYVPKWQEVTEDEARAVFAEKIAAMSRVWVGLDDEKIVAYLAMDGSYVDRLYVDPSHQRSGWGSALLAFAKELSPVGLELHTHTENVGARAFYERHGFVAVRFGTSPPPESLPDVEYHWRPS